MFGCVSEEKIRKSLPLIRGFFFGGAAFWFPQYALSYHLQVSLRQLLILRHAAVLLEFQILSVS